MVISSVPRPPTTERRDTDGADAHTIAPAERQKISADPMMPAPAPAFWPSARAVMVLVLSAMVVAGTAGCVLGGLPGLIGGQFLVAITAIAGLALPGSLTMRLYKGHRATNDNAASFVSILAELSSRAGLEHMPQLYIIPSAAIAAFSSGRGRDRAIAITEGLVRKMSLRETACILAHEIAHIRRGDLAAFGVADAITRLMFGLFALGLVLFVWAIPEFLSGVSRISWPGVGVLLLGPAIVNAIQVLLDRSREFEADEDAVYLSGDPEAVARAIDTSPAYRGASWEDLIFAMRRVPFPSPLRAHPDTASRLSALYARHGDHASARDLCPALIIQERPMITAMAGIGVSALHPRLRWSGTWF